MNIRKIQVMERVHIIKQVFEINKLKILCLIVIARARIYMQQKSIKYAVAYHKYAKNMQNNFFLQINKL